MIDILLLGGTCGEGPVSYETGVFHLPDGTLRGVEDVLDLTVSPPPQAAPRRLGIARGLREALVATGPLPRPLGLAASVMGLGLDVLGGEGHSAHTLELRFADGATASLRTDAEGAARIAGDRAVVRLALLRRSAAQPADAESPMQAPGEPESEKFRSPESRSPETMSPEPGSQGPDARDLASIFTYEKRGGRLRRLAAKALDTPDR